LTKADLVLTDDTPSAEVITDWVESGNGIYVATWTLGADTYALTGSKSKYSFNTLEFVVT
jgi:hypothetical protein